MSHFAIHSEQHGCVRIVAHQCGWLGCRVGEAANPGPASRRRRSRALQWSWDSDTESDDEGRNGARRLESQVDSGEEPLLPPSSPLEEVIRALEADLSGPPRASRRIVLVPQSQAGRPHQFTMRERDCFPRLLLSRQTFDTLKVQEQFNEDSAKRPKGFQPTKNE